METITEEDALLQTAINLEGGGPPYNWKTIAREYFRGSRNHLQCKGRWTKVRKYEFRNFLKSMSIARYNSNL